MFTPVREETQGEMRASIVSTANQSLEDNPTISQSSSISRSEHLQLAGKPSYKSDVIPIRPSSSDPDISERQRQGISFADSPKRRFRSGSPIRSKYGDI